jgi:glutamate N-acetyltransferase/amino-acid N-acetyltransferase
MVKGVEFSAVASGIKAAGLDLGLVYFREAAQVAALYTRNRVKAAHIVYNRRKGRAGVRALLVNSGCANACTGAEGVDDLAVLAKEVARLLDIGREEVLFASTGVIGKRLPLGTIVAALPELVANLGEGHLESFARAIMTTDTFPKIVEEHAPIAGCTIAGVAKGAGMINPLLATMLAFFFTDYPLGPGEARRLLPTLGRESFERISVDGDTSTNDTVMLFSSGRGAARQAIAPFRRSLARLMKALSLLIVKDGEGATKVIHITVKGARQKGIAERIARRIAVSPLVKTAFFGCDPNWGRIIAAAGDAKVPLDPSKVEIALQGEVLAKGGTEVPFSEERLKKLMDTREIELLVHLHDGRGSYDMYTTDLTYDYIKINASYRT